MRLTPAQIAVRLICGEALPRVRDASLPSRIREGHDWLVELTVGTSATICRRGTITWRNRRRVAILTAGTSFCHVSCRPPSGPPSGKRPCGA